MCFIQRERIIIPMRRYLVIGAGGIGSHLVEPLGRMLEYSDTEPTAIVIVDGDTYEEKNRSRQSFKDIGNKAEILAAELSELFEETIIVGLNKWVVSDTSEVVTEDGENASNKITAGDLLNENDVVYAVVDNFMARHIILEAARFFQNIDVFLGGNDEDMFGSVYHYRRVNGQDITQNPNDFKPEFQNPTDRNPGELSCQERAEIDGGTQLIVANFGVAATLLARTQATIIEESDPIEILSVSEIFFDLREGLMNNYDRRVKNTQLSNNKTLVENKG